MSEKCKTCANFKPYIGGHARGACETLPSAVQMSHFDNFSVSENFGCAGHVPKPQEPHIMSVLVTSKLPGGPIVTDDCTIIAREQWEKVIAAVEKARKV